MPLETINILLYIRDEMEFLISDSNNTTYAAFEVDKKAINAYCRSLEIIGEACKQLTKGFKQNFPQVDWKGFSGLRDIIIHQYFGIDYDIIWLTIINEIPETLDEIKRIITFCEENPPL